MKTIKFILLTVLFINNFLFSQSISVVAGLNEEKSVIVRWFSNTEFNIEGVNIYKRQLPDENWLKINISPIKRKSEVDKNNPDSLLRLYSALTYNKPEDDESGWRLIILAKGILDPKFSDFYGMQYIDTEVERGKTYQYKVVRIVNNQESESSVSNEVKVGDYISPEAPEGFGSNAGDGFVNFKWKHDKKKFFAYNIYRTETGSQSKLRINENPVMVFSFRDAEGKETEAEYFFNDTTVTNGITYSYELTGINFLGQESRFTSQIKATPKDLIPPPPAYNLTTVVRFDSVIVSWEINRVKDLKEINILRGNEFSGKYDKINKTPINVSDTFYVDVIKNAEQVYYYIVESVDFSGNVSKSFPKAVVIEDITPPAVPENLTAIGEVGRVVLNWKENTEKDLAGYFIWRSFSGEEDDFLLLTTEPHQSNTYIDSLAKEISNIIIYRIKALDKSFNESDYSKTVNVRMKDVTKPAQPIILSVQSESSYVKINWVDNTEPDLLGYNVFYGNENQSNVFIKLNSKPIEANYFETEIKQTGNYNFFINAIDSTGNQSENSDTLECSVIFEQTGSQKIDIISADYNTEKKSVFLKWNKINNVIGYIVYRKPAEEELFESISELLQNESYEDENIGEQNYNYYIRAILEDGELLSNEVQVIVR